MEMRRHLGRIPRPVEQVQYVHHHCSAAENAPEPSLMLWHVQTVVPEAYCAFGFGGFNCNAPYSGWGEILLIVMLVLMGSIAILALAAAWLIFRWWQGRQG